MKKTLLVFVISSGLLSGLFSCFCKDDTPFWLMKDFDTTLYNSNLTSVISDSTTVDTLVIAISTNPIFTANLSALSQLFINSAYAFSCPKPGNIGFKHKLTKVEIISDQDFNQFDSGADLSSLCFINGQTIQEFVQEEIHPAYGNIRISINQKPSQSLLRSFTIRFEFVNSSYVTNTSQSILWQ